MSSILACWADSTGLKEVDVTLPSCRRLAVMRRLRSLVIFEAISTIIHEKCIIVKKDIVLSTTFFRCY